MGGKPHKEGKLLENMEKSVEETAPKESAHDQLIEKIKEQAKTELTGAIDSLIEKKDKIDSFLLVAVTDKQYLMSAIGSNEKLQQGIRAFIKVQPKAGVLMSNAIGEVLMELGTAQNAPKTVSKLDEIVDEALGKK